VIHSSITAPEAEDPRLGKPMAMRIISSGGLNGNSGPLAIFSRNS
jgi:hypothetical protein